MIAGNRDGPVSLAGPSKRRRRNAPSLTRCRKNDGRVEDNETGRGPDIPSWELKTGLGERRVEVRRRGESTTSTPTLPARLLFPNRSRRALHRRLGRSTVEVGICAHFKDPSPRKQAEPNQDPTGCTTTRKRRILDCVGLDNASLHKKSPHPRPHPLTTAQGNTPAWEEDWEGHRVVTEPPGGDLAFDPGSRRETRHHCKNRVTRNKDNFKTQKPESRIRR